MGCTGRGTPNTTPVIILNNPDVTSVEARSMELWRARASVSGRKVPRSPRAPDISAAGVFHNVFRFRRLTARRLPRPAMLRNSIQELTRCFFFPAGVAAWEVGPEALVTRLPGLAFRIPQVGCGPVDVGHVHVEGHSKRSQN